MSDIKPNVFPAKDGSDKKDLYVTPATTEAEAKAVEEMRKRTEAQLAQMNKTKVDVPTPAVSVVEEPKDVLSPLAEPKWGAPYDLVPLPSKGKLYKGIRDVVRVSYMSGSDENILTSPNLLKSGKFLEVLIRRNLLEANLDYRKLHTGDRNALMVWLRSTAFGHMYSISIYNSKGEVEDIEFDLSTLKTIELTVDPDANGHFEHVCPITKDVIKFQFITVGDEEDIEAMLDADVANGVEVNNRSTYTLQRQIVSVNGVSDYEYIKTYVDNMRVGAIKAFRTYVNNIESGIDLNVQIRTSGGESITTFLPINVNFFWPDI
jgi:hypothetical protein